ncbi:MAG TPA: aldo/keto reductase family protein [Gaiellaceae bacterium]|jgi:aryl-alcohol dehydrogenase-like predicted oxidoreductase|nr:aldo/keto reductase family protein [Gaiellaceae bacterium]
MEYRRLGASDLEVSAIGLGSWLTYGDELDYERSRACIRRALELGITLFDTANVYGRGAAESFLAEALAGVPRSSYVLATKVYFPMSRTDMGLSAEQVRKQCDGSLERLGTDYIDLYQCHRYDSRTPLEETMGALTELVREGKVRHIGFSEWTPEQIQASLDLPEGERFVSSQPQYSLLWRQPEARVFPLCAANGIGQIVWSPLGQGVLTGKYRPGERPPADSRAERTRGRVLGRLYADETLEAVQRLRPIAQSAGLTMAQLALAWVLRRGEVAAALVGATRPDQLDENVGAAGVRLSADVLAAIDDALAPVLAA